MTESELVGLMAGAVSGVGFVHYRDRKAAARVFAALREAGMAVVPVKPTDAMLGAGDLWTDGDLGEVRAIWTAMLSAAMGK